MILKVISGGQTGVDLAGLRAARLLNISTGGWMPKGFMTERGPRPWIGELYRLKEHSADKYPPRTALNIKDADLTLILAYVMSGGSALTRDICFRQHKPVFHVNEQDMLLDGSLKEIAIWIAKRPHSIVNIAGGRESKSPGIGKIAESFLIRLFKVVNQ